MFCKMAVTALERAGEMREDEKLTAWFHQVLSNTLALGHHVHDLPEQRVAPHSLGAHDDTAGDIDGAVRHLVADFDVVDGH